jgi:hypothetical protein
MPAFLRSFALAQDGHRSRQEPDSIPALRWNVSQRRLLISASAMASKRWLFGDATMVTKI